MLHTITIILKEKYEIGRDPFNAPIYEYADTPAEGYLVAPLNPEAVMSAKQAKQWQHLGLKSDEGGVLLSQKSDEAKEVQISAQAKTEDIVSTLSLYGKHLVTSMLLGCKSLCAKPIWKAPLRKNFPKVIEQAPSRRSATWYRA